jgi:glycine/D-amino acid oxidase-like deaminating enzyme
LTLVGPEDANPLGESPDADANHTDPAFVARAIDQLCLRLPVMEQGALHNAHSGYDGITSDQRSLVGAAGPEGFYLDCGHSGAGFKIAPAVGLCLSELILDGAAKAADISILSPNRFAEGRPIKGNYESLWS